MRVSRPPNNHPPLCSHLQSRNRLESKGKTVICLAAATDSNAWVRSAIVFCSGGSCWYSRRVGCRLIPRIAILICISVGNLTENVALTALAVAYGPFPSQSFVSSADRKVQGSTVACSSLHSHRPWLLDALTVAGAHSCCRMRAQRRSGARWPSGLHPKNFDWALRSGYGC